MRPDGDPERDDYGLPHVDVVIPDDARELDRDLLAYRREERQRRRHARVRRLLRPFTRSGLAVPLIAGALIIALVGGALITVFGPRPTPDPPRRSVVPRSSAAPGKVGGPLPDAEVTVSGSTTPLRDVRPGVIGIVPPGCRCQAVLTELARRTSERKLKFWVVAAGRNEAGTVGKPGKRAVDELRSLADGVRQGRPAVVDDARGVLTGTYGAPPVPGGTPGVTAVLVHTDGVVGAVRHSVKPGPELTSGLDALQRPSPILAG